MWNVAAAQPDSLRLQSVGFVLPRALLTCMPPTRRMHGNHAAHELHGSQAHPNNNASAPLAAHANQTPV